MKTKTEEQIAIIMVALVGTMLIMIGFAEPIVVLTNAHATRIHHTSCSVDGKPVDCGGP